MNDSAMCNSFQESESSICRKKRFGYPYLYPVPVRKQFLDIRVWFQIYYPVDIQRANGMAIISVCLSEMFRL